jgi:predicted RNase H-like HicB family nuclease
MTIRIGGVSMSQKVGVVIERDERGYSAYCSELEGCQSQGDSSGKVLSNIKEAIELYLETLSEEERNAALSKEILTTTVGVNIA